MSFSGLPFTFFRSAVSISKCTEGPYNRLHSKSTFVQIACLPITVHEGFRFQRQYNGTKSHLGYFLLLAAEQDGPVKYQTQVGCPYVSDCCDRLHLIYVKTTNLCCCTSVKSVLDLHLLVRHLQKRIYRNTTTNVHAGVSTSAINC